MESANLNLCKEHKQEWKRSEYDRHNCDHCRLQKENADLRRLLREVMIDVRMGNRDLYHEIRRLRPEVKTIVDKGEAK